MDSFIDHSVMFAKNSDRNSMETGNDKKDGEDEIMVIFEGQDSRDDSQVEEEKKESTGEEDDDEKMIDNSAEEELENTGDVSGDIEPKSPIKKDVENVVENIAETIDEENDDSRVEEEEVVEEKSAKIEDQEVPEVDSAFPAYMRGSVLIGKAIPINKKTWNEIDIDGNDSILDCPSQVVPLVIKKPNIFPPKLKTEERKPIKPIKQKDNDDDDEDGENVIDLDEDEEDLDDENSKDYEEEKQQQDNNKSTMLTISDFYKSSVGNFLMGIGLSRAKEWFHKDAIRQVHKSIRKEGEVEELIDELKKQQHYYSECKAANSVFSFKMKKCHLCEFKTESDTILEGHYNIPHLTPRKEYKCNFCLFQTRDPRTIMVHFQHLHKKPCIIETPPQLYECPVCPYESSQKQKATTHITKCLKFFNPEKVQILPDLEVDYPTITPKPITQEDIKIYEATLQALRSVVLHPQSGMPNIPGLPRGLQQQMLAMQQQQMAQQNRNRIMKHQFKNPGMRPGNSSIPMYGLSPGNYNKSSAPQLYHMLAPGGHTQLIPLNSKVPQNSSPTQLHAMKGKFVVGSGSPLMHKGATPNKPNILAKANSGNPMMNKADPSGKSGTFVICEICDGYIKDLEQLRTHMQWIHKVKIHPKMLASRPPLNCQKCQWRFFTDQGLERHLLGAHGLVTSNMQDMVNQNQDGGRCTICGRVFANKLVAHMNQVHKINLKPAHLSYKCTVCSATFNLYRLFENHVYMVHSGSVKRNSDDHSLAAKKQKVSVEIKPSNEKRHHLTDQSSTSHHMVINNNQVVRIKSN